MAVAAVAVVQGTIDARQYKALREECSGHGGKRTFGGKGQQQQQQQQQSALVLQRYAVYSTRKNETPALVAKSLGLPLPDLLRWNQNK